MGKKYKPMIADEVPSMKAVAQTSETCVSKSSDSYQIGIVVYSSDHEIEAHTTNEVEEWLKGFELQQYAVNFKQNGFASMDMVKIISDGQELIDIGIADKYHRNELLRQILQLDSIDFNRMVSRDVDEIDVGQDN